MDIIPPFPGFLLSAFEAFEALCKLKEVEEENRINNIIDIIPPFPAELFYSCFESFMFVYNEWQAGQTRVTTILQKLFPHQRPLYREVWPQLAVNPSNLTI